MTINGAAVHIGEGGKIDKGPKELMDKSEHEGHAHGHRAKATMHREAGQRKGAGHPDSAVHRAAGNEHGNAAMERENAHAAATRGDMAAARKHANNAEEHATKASANEARIGTGKGPEPSTSSVKPQAHKGLHADAEEDVKGSEKHEAEHKRLMKEYDKSKTNWEKNAVNSLVSKNAEQGAKANAQTKHHKALSLSERAKATQEPSHHKEALAAIDDAHAAHGKAGGDGVKAKQKELETMRKPHAKAVEKDQKKQPHPDFDYDTAIKNVASSTAAPEHKKAAIEALQAAQAKAGKGKPDHHVEADRHQKAATAAQQKGDSEGARAHANAYRAHLDAAKGQGGADYEQRKGVAKRASEKADGGGDIKSHPNFSKPDYDALKAKGHSDADIKKIWDKDTEQGKPGPNKRHDIAFAKAGAKSTSALGKIAAKAAKKAAEEAADQDPKHKK